MGKMESESKSEATIEMISDRKVEEKSEIVEEKSAASFGEKTTDNALKQLDDDIGTPNEVIVKSKEIEVSLPEKKRVDEEEVKEPVKGDEKTDEDEEESSEEEETSEEEEDSSEEDESSEEETSEEEEDEE